MAIQKVKLINLVGHIHDFDKSVLDYIVDQPIHLENTMEILEDAVGLYPFVYENPYTELYGEARELIDLSELNPDDMPSHIKGMSEDNVANYCAALKKMLLTNLEEKKQLEQEHSENLNVMKQLEPMRSFGINLQQLFDFEYIKFRFGKLPKDSYKKLNTYLGDMESFFFSLDIEQDYVYGIYFAPEALEEKIDNIFSLLYFERIRISGKAFGTPEQAILQLENENERIIGKIQTLDKEIARILNVENTSLFSAFKTASNLYRAYNVRQVAAQTKESFYILGWVPEDDVAEFENRINKEDSVTFMVEEPEMCKKMPPTKLKNWKIFKPFEDFVKMYGLPAYNEFDPTVLFALSYVLMFGIMFGDVGNGLVLGLVGLYFGFRRGSFIGKIMVWVGVSSMIFGALYGSVFGYEELIPTIWIKPLGNSVNTNNILIYSVVLGVGLLSIAMFLNILNGIRQRKVGKILFSPNGLAGIVFYWATIYAAFGAFTGGGSPHVGYVIGLIVFPLLLILFAEPLTHLLEKKEDWLPKKKGAYLLESFFEGFEVVLSYITNTISFVRVGAFALNHAGMLMVVFIFAKMTQGAASVMIVIVGNLMVIALEALLVGIQVLRLQFYEMFSRYFEGTGHPFKPKNLERK